MDEERPRKKGTTTSDSGSSTIYRKDFWTGRLTPVGRSVQVHNDSLPLPDDIPPPDKPKTVQQESTGGAQRPTNMKLWHPDAPLVEGEE